MIRRFWILAVTLGAMGCASPEQRVAVGADQLSAPTEGGIGGTGIKTATGEGGIGGTGAPRYAAAVGTVTGFGSIHINGVRIVFPPSGSVPSPSGVLAESDVELGETLEVLGTMQPDGAVRPVEAMFRFPLVGRIDSVANDGASLTIMGARVVPERGAAIVDSAGRPVVLIAGDSVQVSGLLRGDAVVASRIERLDGPTRSSVMGRVEPGAMPGTVVINGVTVNYGASQPPQAGWTVRVTGVPEASGLVPYETVRSLLETISATVPDLSVEGYLERRVSTTGYGIGGFGRDFDAGSKVRGLAGERAIFIGSLEQGAFKARHGLRLPDEAGERRARLEAVRNGYAPAGALPTR